MGDIIGYANDSLGRVLEFYEKIGTPLNYTPKIEYIDGLCEQRQDVIAMVSSEVKMIEKSLDFISQNLSKTIWKEGYGLDVSDEAIAEVAGLSNSRIRKNFEKLMVTKEFESGADIVIFRPYLKRNGDDILVHEVWHLIEKDSGVMSERPLISEGTATYAMKRFMGKRCNKPFEQFTDFYRMLYDGTANIVQGAVENSDNPYSAMLDNQVRLQIEQKFISKLKPVIMGLARNLLEDENMKKIALQSLRDIPHFRELEGNLSHQGIISAYNAMGANKLADELQMQNLDVMIKEYRKIGF